MTVESDVHAALSALVDGRVYPDVAGAGAVLPWIVYQQVGGAAVESLDVGRSGYRNATFQLSCWAADRAAAAALARTVEDTLTASATLQATALGAMAADHEPDTKRYGARQDFSVWY